VEPGPRFRTAARRTVPPGAPASPQSLPDSSRSAWLTLHAVNRRPIHPMFFSRSSARALVLSLFRTHVWMAIEAAFPTTCSSLVTSPASSPLFLSGMESVSAGSVQAITGAIYFVVLLFGERSKSRPRCL